MPLRRAPQPLRHQDTLRGLSDVRVPYRAPAARKTIAFCCGHEPLGPVGQSTRTTEQQPSQTAMHA
eukprot:11175969-Lingulodinium_polyedra.AAC.1